MVFQNYALYPYMNVFENIAFGLRARKTPQAEIESRVRRAADMLGITPLLDRLPRQLSGGQRQRVAIGRAIVRTPKLFLFDEPLSNLDAALRVATRIEIARLHRELASTMIYVTHDQVEAMTLANRIVVLNAGRVEQVGAPMTLYNDPANRFVAGFLGSPQMNFIPAQLAQSGGGWAVRLGDGSALALPVRPRDGFADGRAIVLGLRPQYLTRANGSGRPGHQRLGVAVELVQPTGSRAYITFPLGGVPTVAELESHDVQRPGERIDLDLDMNRAVLIDPESNRVI
jgi:multiple sugar transport system ATP-binding protein